MDTNRDDIAAEHREHSDTQQHGKNTGWAIIVAVIAAFFFYIAYWLLFTFVVGVYAAYDQSFSTSLGALVLVVFGSNVLAFASGAIVARKAFPRANPTGLFYGLATLLIALAAIMLLRELARPDWSWVVIAINVAVAAITIFVVRAFLLSSDV